MNKNGIILNNGIANFVPKMNEKSIVKEPGFLI